ncbi:MAG TPA: gamma-glutamyl-gamma-aminobutyrate hydrolase family protein [Solirubrobacteraceae bacterium]|nr:gamma-glutamyl-gamma-aminobutyrate hydrolase family protein [Solirubrobacteraceae bacterium]
MTPNIGVSCNVEDIRYGGLWTERAAMVPMTYVRAVTRAGGRPLLIAPTPADLADPDPLLDLLDGVLITGGADLAAETYGASAHPETAPSDAGRDAFEVALVRAASERDLPCLGICRGMQVVNVAHGGTLEQHLPDRLARDIHRGPDGDFADHHVEVEPGSLAAVAAGDTRVAVRSYHHQGVERVGAGLRVTARAEGDATVEAVEDASRRFMLGVLWHPEEDEADRLIGAFVRECRARAAAAGA